LPGPTLAARLQCNGHLESLARRQVALYYECGSAWSRRQRACAAAGGVRVARLRRTGLWRDRI